MRGCNNKKLIKMKKLIIFSVLLVATMMFVTNQSKAQTTDDVTFNLSMTVDKYIECMPSPVSWDFGTTSHQVNYGGPMESLYGAMGEWNVGYANCPFSITISGNNDANQGVPRFARQEVGAHGGDYDILPTLYQIHFTTNGVQDLFYGTWLQGAHQFPYTKSYSEAPHNGQIKMDMKAYINSSIASEAVPIRKTLIDPTFTNIQSADAGEYTCKMLVTITAL